MELFVEEISIAGEKCHVRLSERLSACLPFYQFLSSVALSLPSQQTQILRARIRQRMTFRGSLNFRGYNYP